VSKTAVHFQKKAALKKNKNIFCLDVAGKKKGFYICTRLSDKMLKER
jgi:hypothetical protein